MLAATAAALRRRYLAAAVQARCAGTTAAAGELPLSFPAVCMWGANTGVGKTLFSAGLAAAAQRGGLAPAYLKPVQTGFPEHSDARLVAAVLGCSERHAAHAAELLDSAPPAAGSSPAAQALCKTLFAWRAAVSPHLAVQLEGAQHRFCTLVPAA